MKKKSYSGYIIGTILIFITIFGLDLSKNIAYNFGACIWAILGILLIILNIKRNKNKTELYSCSNCNSNVVLGQQKCKNCGSKLSWPND